MDTTGSLEVLNICKGHLSISFDKGDPADTERAKHIIGDMLKRGYSLFVEDKGVLKKVKRFDAKREEYVIVEGPADPAATRPIKTKPERVPMRRGKATGIGPTAGG